MSPEPLTRADLLKAINRCMEAYNSVNDPNENAYESQYVSHANRRHTRFENQNRASLAYLSRLPILFDPRSCRLYIACIAHGASIGAIDPLDVGRYCHVAQAAMSAWKLDQNQAPLPPKGNHSGDDDGRRAPVPSHYGTRDRRQAADRPSMEPEEGHPLPPKGNQWDAEDGRNPILELAMKWEQEPEWTGPLPGERELRGVLPG